MLAQMATNETSTAKQRHLIREPYTKTEKPAEFKGVKKATKHGKAKTHKSSEGDYDIRKFYDFLTLAAAFQDKYGWTPANDKRYESTADLAYKEVNAFKYTSALKVMDSHAKLARKAVKWAANLKDSDVDQDNYLMNVRRIARMKRVFYDNRLFAGSIVNAYIKRVLTVNKPDETDNVDTSKENVDIRAKIE